MTAFKLKTTLVAASSILAIGVAGCREDQTAAIAVPDPTPAAFIAGPAGLPDAPPAPVNWYGPDEGYRWAERAYGMQRAFYETPPDYAFDYGGYQPWVWETADDWAMYAEPWDDGYRYYYYEPGGAHPYFVYDGDYGYGYDPLGALVALFDADGDYLPIDYYDDMAPLAGRYYHQGRLLRTAGLNAAPVYVDEPVWIERAPLVLASAEPWIRAANEDEAWRSWRQRAGDQELKRFWKEEKRREKEAAKWARQIRRDEARQYAASAYAAPQTVAPGRMDGAFARAPRDDQRRLERQARDDQRRFQQAARQEQRARDDQRRFAQAARQEQRAAERAQKQNERRWAEANARNAAFQGGGGGGPKFDRGGGGGGGPKFDRGGGGAQAAHGGGGPKAQHGGGGPKAHHGGGGKPDHAGGGHGGGGGDKGGGGKGGGKKD